MNDIIQIEEIYYLYFALVCYGLGIYFIIFKLLKCKKDSEEIEISDSGDEVEPIKREL